MYIKIPNTPFALETEKTRYGFIVILSAPEHFPRGVVGRPLPTEEDAESTLKNFLERYETANKHGYQIDQIGAGEIIFSKGTPRKSWTADAINLDETSTEFEESLHRDWGERKNESM